jgi:hypothetical protein
MTDKYSNTTGARTNSKIEKLIKESQYKPKSTIKTMTEELKEFEEDKCNNYKMKLIHLLLPPSDTFSKVCISYDKTYLFIITFSRIILFLILTKLYYDILGLKDETKWMTYQIGFWFLFVYMCINILFLIIVITKKQRIPKKD